MIVKCSRCGNEDLEIGRITAANGGQGSTEYKCECGSSGEVIRDETARGPNQKSTWARGGIEEI